jgi:hypothetical protein
VRENKNKGIEAFAKIQDLINHYIQSDSNNETPEKLAIGIHALLLEIGEELQKINVTTATESIVMIDAQTAKIINNLDSNEAEVLPAEKLFKLLMSGRLEEAEKLIVSIIDLEEKRKKKFKKGYSTDLANERHKPNKDRKYDAINYYKANRGQYKSKDAAAEDLANRFPGLSVDTYRDALKGI